MPGRNAFQANVQAQPPDRELAEAIERVRGCKRNPVVGADRFRHVVEIRQHFRNRLVRDLRIVLGEIVQIGDIGLVMPVVMDLHRLGIDVRLQRIRGVGERVELEGT